MSAHAADGAPADGRASKALPSRAATQGSLDSSPRGGWAGSLRMNLRQPDLPGCPAPARQWCRRSQASIVFGESAPFPKGTTRACRGLSRGMELCAGPVPPVADRSDDSGVTDNMSATTRVGEPWIMPREYEIGAVRWFSEAVKEMSRALHPLLAQIPRVELAEGPGPPPDGAPLPSEASPLYRPMKISHEWTVSVEDVVNFDVQQFLADLYAVADDTGGQMVRGLLDLVTDVTERTGNVIDGAGRDFFEVFADTLETIEMTFDDQDRPNLTIVMHPNQMEKLRGKQPTAEQEARINAILERRREEWRASRRRRDLP